jgi:hypothetical protein
MSRNKQWWDYYTEAEMPMDGQVPTTDPAAGGLGSAANTPPADQQGGQQPPKDQSKEQPKPSNDREDDDITNDPSHPDMPDHEDDKDFEDWRNEFFKLAIKGDPQEMVDACKKMRDRDLDPTQRKFVEDNLQIAWFRQDPNIDKLSKAVRKLLKQQIDKNYPSTSLMQHIVNSMQEQPSIYEAFYKLPGFYGMKGDLHRKVLAAILGAVQIGGGGSREDLVYNEKDYSVNVSTRFSTEWGEISLGKWAVQVDDPERFLEEPELARLKDGAPEERTVLRHRIVLSSISERFKTRAFLFNVVNPDGTIHCLSWDMGDSLLAGYRDGKLVVRTKSSEAAEAVIDDDGNVIPISDLTIRYVKETGKRDDTGTPYKEEFEFMERINGMLYLTADLKTIRDMSNMQGVFFHEIPFNGNPSDIKMFQRCIPSLTEMLMRKC